jgi:thymidylate synthase ThyX
MSIFIYDEFNPEDNAMLQALYSRSSASVQDHVKKVKKSGSGKFMENFYVGYGHNSIADCGSTTIFIENVSIPVTKAFQAHSLYAGQESSTRYIDMGSQPLSDPVATASSQQILRSWMEFYLSSMEPVKRHIAQQFPRGSDEDPKTYDKAVAARAFDILRGFLPAGVQTQFSWHTNLRQAHDSLDILIHHPLGEVRQVATEVLTQLKAKYPHSFSHKTYPASEIYRQYQGDNYAYYNPTDAPEFRFSSSIKPRQLARYSDILSTRPPKTLLPQFLLELGLCQFDFLLDFGSFRDLQRHRNGVCRIPLLTTRFGFNQWYLEQLPDNLRAGAEQLIGLQSKRIARLNCDELERQLYVAMGFNIACRVSYGLPATVYTVELRSGNTVHPTLRRVAHQMSRALERRFKSLKLHSDYSPDDWDVRRGTQDIVEKSPKS